MRQTLAVRPGPGGSGRRVRSDAARDYMWANLEEAASDVSALPISEAFDRFISWTRHQ